jgi:hypothetical protein
MAGRHRKLKERDMEENPTRPLYIPHEDRPRWVRWLMFGACWVVVAAFVLCVGYFAATLVLAWGAY